MRNLKKFLALVLAMIMIAGATAVVSADFTDVAADNTYASAINDLAVKGIVRGTSDTTFAPEADVQRYQMALFVARAATGEVGEEADSTLWANGHIPFADVTEYKGAIQYAFLNGIIKGRTATTFDPAGNIAYVDALTMAVRALGYTDLEYPWGFYGKAVDLGLTANVAVEDIYTTLNRAETAQVIYNMIYAQRADSDVSFATENFELDVVRSSDLFVITATPLQAYAEGYTSKDHKEEGTFVGIQQIVNGIPEGDMIYVPVEKLGIEAADVENYLNYAVELINYDAEAGTFYDAVLGTAPVRVYSKDVEFDKNSDTKIVIDGTIYNMVETVSGSALKRELVAFAGADVNTYVAKDLVMIGETVVNKNKVGVATFKGYVGNTRYFAAHVDVDIDGDGKDDIVAGTIIPEDLALEAWGYEAQGTKYIKYSTMTAKEIENAGAFELQLFDDNNDGKYDRTVVNTVYVTVYGTYEKDLDPKAKDGKEICDKLYNTHAVEYNKGVTVAADKIAEDIEAADVAYSEKLSVGTVFTYTYNAATNYVYVVDTLALQTEKLNKIDTTLIDENGDSVYRLTLGDTVYSAKNAYRAGELDAVPMPFNTAEALTLKNLNKAATFDIQTNWSAFLKTIDLGWEYNFYEINGKLIFIEAVPGAAAAKIEFVVLNSVADFDFGVMDLNVFADGEEKTVALTKFKGTTLADLPSWYFGLFLGQTQNFLKGLIYAINNTPDGINVLGFVDETTYDDYTYLDANGNEKQYLQLIDDSSVLVDNGVITFDRGIVRKGAGGVDLPYASRLRTTDTTVFYFIDYGTGIANEADTEITVYVGSPEDATITVDQYTTIYVDKIGYSANVTNQGSTQLVIVVNAKDYDFDVKAESQYVYFTGAPAEYEADEAVDFDLEGYAKDARFYKYTDGAINLETGEYVTMYTPVDTLTAGKIYELDENGVIIDYDALNDTTVANYGMTTADAATAGLILDWSGDAVVIDNLVEEKYYDIKVNGATQFDYDDYKITKVRVINIGADHTAIRGADDTVDPRPAGDSDDILYEAGSIQTAWNLVHNLFHYSAANGDTLTSCFVWNESAANTDGEIVILYAYN